MAGFILSSGDPVAGRAAARIRPSESKRRKRTTRGPRRWAPNALPQVKMICGHWQESWPEIRSFPRGFVKVFCDLCGEWKEVVDLSKLPSNEDLPELF